MVLKTSGRTYEPCTETVVADGKPHERCEINLAAVSDVVPMKLVYCSGSELFDLTPDNYGGGDGQGAIWLVEIPLTYPSRTDMDKTTAFPASSTKVPAVKLQLGRKYHVTSGNLTAENEGLILKCGANGIVDEPAVPANTTPDTIGFGFSLVEAVSTSESVVEFLGLIMFDDSA